MTEYDYYVGYQAAQDQIRERVQRTQRSRVPGQRRRGPGRRAIARGLHSLADRFDG